MAGRVARAEQEVTVADGARWRLAVADLPPVVRVRRGEERVRVRLDGAVRLVNVSKVRGLMRAQLSLFEEVTDV